jgi:FxsC-like protein
MVGEQGGEAPYFFLSYARTPRHNLNSSIDPNVWVHKLYDDLSAEVMQLMKSPVAGFMDTEIRVGTQWSRRLTAALAACRVFVPLYSPRYFASENCGKEWYAFSRRVLDQRAHQPDTEMAIVPALWAPMEGQSMPGVAEEIQFNNYDLGERYAQLGFIGIMKVTRYQDDYILAVQGLARRIVEVANASSIDPGSRIDFATSESAFGDTEEHQMTEKRMKLTVVALDVAHLREGRSDKYYGRTPLHWRPYYPLAEMPIIDYAMELAHYMGCQPRVTTLRDHLRDAARGVTAPGLFLIDAWAAMSEQCREELRRLDELDQHWTSVLYPWNREDEQTVTAGDRLRENLESCLGRKVAGLPRRYQRAAIDIETIEDFGDVMAPMIMQMRRRYLKKAAAYLPDGARQERPRLRVQDDDDGEGAP